MSCIIGTFWLGYNLIKANGIVVTLELVAFGLMFVGMYCLAIVAFPFLVVWGLIRKGLRYIRPRSYAVVDS